MRTIRVYGLKFLAFSVVATALAGCWKEKFSDCPGGNIILETIWEVLDDQANIPERYRAVIGGYSEVLTGNYNEIDQIFNPGDYRIYVYNMPEKMTVRGTTATVAVDGAGINNMPGYLFTYSGEVAGLMEDEYRTVHAYMMQQVGRIYYEITVRGGASDNIRNLITSVNSAKLEGIASSIDIGTSVLSGPSSVSPQFVPDKEIYTAESRILGTVGPAQTLTLDLTLPSGATQILSGDAAPVLAGFNTYKLGSYRIVINITAFDQNGSILDWTLGGEPGTAM